MVLPLDGRPILLPGTRFDRKAVSTLISDVRTGFDLASHLRGALKDAGLDRARLAVAGTDVMPFYYSERLRKDFPHVQLESADDLIEGLRVVKSPLELKLMSEAADICELGFQAAFRASRAGVTEVDIANAAYTTCMTAGADRVDRTRVRAGKEVVVWSRWPLSTLNRVRDGDMVFFDMVGWYKNYAFDELRCWTISKPTAQQRALLEEALHLTERMCETARPGKTVGAWVQETKDYFRPRRFGEALSMVGHGIGLEVVENPWFESQVTMPLTPGMVLCLESGFVIPGKAHVRIEKEIVIEKTGARFLGTFPPRLWR